MAKKKEKKAEEGAPAWMLTFGDMMALLLCFFVLLFSISTISKAKFAKVLGSIINYFGVGASEIVQQQEVKPEEIFVRIIKAESQDLKHFGTLIENYDGFDVLVTTIREGLKLVIGGKPLFEHGSPRLQPGAEKLILKLAGLVKGHRNRILVLGHTSTLPWSASQFKGDFFDLGFARARAVCEVLTGKKGQVNPKRIRIGSAGSNEPVSANFGEGRTEFRNQKGVTRRLDIGRMFNRRVEIIVTEELIPWAQLAGGTAGESDKDREPR